MDHQVRPTKWATVLDWKVTEEAAEARRILNEATPPSTFAGIETPVSVTAINCERFKYAKNLISAF